MLHHRYFTKFWPCICLIIPIKKCSVYDMTQKAKRKWTNLFSSFYKSMYEAMLSSYQEKCWLCYTNLWSLPAPSLWATSKTWTQTLDPGTKPWKTWTLKNLDPEKPGHWKTFDLERHGKRLDMEKWLEEHI